MPYGHYGEYMVTIMEPDGEITYDSAWGYLKKDALENYKRLNPAAKVVKIELWKD